MTALERAGDRELVDAGKVRSWTQKARLLVLPVPPGSFCLLCSRLSGGGHGSQEESSTLLAGQEAPLVRRVQGRRKSLPGTETLLAFLAYRLLGLSFSFCPTLPHL